jgi:hypothetical protein
MKEYIPLGCTIITEFPSIVNSVNSYKVVKTELFLNDKNIRRDVFSSNCVLFWEDLACLRYAKTILEKTKKEFVIEPFLIFRKKDVVFSFYKVKEK